jgi:hypothetical protein
MQQAVEHGADRGSITQQLAVPQFRYKSNLSEARVVIASLYLVCLSPILVERDFRPAI